MKELTKISRVAGYLEKIYRFANADFFGNELGTVVITLKSTPDAYGHISIGERWTVNEDGKRELNISTSYLSRDIVEVVATLLHEMVHEYCLIHDIKDTSRGGSYHNKRFKEIAEEKVGLQIEYDKRIGWSVTHATETVIDFCIRHDLTDIQMCDHSGLGRGFFGGGSSTTGGTPGAPGTKVKKPSSTRKYECPCCGCSVRATKSVRIMCIDCQEEMQVVN